MLAADRKEPVYDITDMAEKVKNGQEYSLMKLFFQCDYLIFREILSGIENYTGKIVTDKEEYNIRVNLKRNLEYKGCIKELYENFIRNGVVWTTINSPYINKFANVFLEGWDKPIGKGEQIKEIRIDLGKYDRYKKYDMVPHFSSQQYLY